MGGSRFAFPGLNLLTGRLGVIDKLPIKLGAGGLLSLQIHKNNEPMPRIMIECSRIGEPVPVAFVSSRASFERSPFEGKRVRCSHCGEAHAWEKEEAWIEDESDKRGAAGAAS